MMLREVKSDDQRNADLPDEFDAMPAEDATLLLRWIFATFVHAKSEYRSSDSYGLKHQFERSEGGVYVSNGQFKGAMLTAGFLPINKSVRNWTFKVRVVQEGKAGK